MTGELINMDGIGTALVSIADKLGMTLMQMYDVYYRAQFVMAMVQIIFILLWCIIVSCVIYYVYKTRGCVERDRYSSMPLGVEMIIASLVVSFATGIVLLLLYEPVIAILCPDYTALQSLMKDIMIMVKSMK